MLKFIMQMMMKFKKVINYFVFVFQNEHKMRVVLGVDNASKLTQNVLTLTMSL